LNNNKELLSSLRQKSENLNNQITLLEQRISRQETQMKVENLPPKPRKSKEKPGGTKGK